MHEQRLLKNTNPKAYEELIEFYPEYGINMYKQYQLIVICILENGSVHQESILI